MTTKINLSHFKNINKRNFIVPGQTRTGKSLINWSSNSSFIEVSGSSSKATSTTTRSSKSLSIGQSRSQSKSQAKGQSQLQSQIQSESQNLSFKSQELDLDSKLETSSILSTTSSVVRHKFSQAKLSSSPNLPSQKTKMMAPVLTERTTPNFKNFENQKDSQRTSSSMEDSSDSFLKRGSRIGKRGMKKNKQILVKKEVENISLKDNCQEESETSSGMTGSSLKRKRNTNSTKNGNGNSASISDNKENDFHEKIEVQKSSQKPTKQKRSNPAPKKPPIVPKKSKANMVNYYKRRQTLPNQQLIQHNTGARSNSSNISSSRIDTSIFDFEEFDQGAGMSQFSQSGLPNSSSGGQVPNVHAHNCTAGSSILSNSNFTNQILPFNSTTNYPYHDAKSLRQTKSSIDVSSHLKFLDSCATNNYKKYMTASYCAEARRCLQEDTDNVLNQSVERRIVSGRISDDEQEQRENQCEQEIREQEVQEVQKVSNTTSETFGITVVRIRVF